MVDTVIALVTGCCKTLQTTKLKWPELGVGSCKIVIFSGCYQHPMHIKSYQKHLFSVFQPEARCHPGKVATWKQVCHLPPPPPPTHTMDSKHTNFNFSTSQSPVLVHNVQNKCYITSLSLTRSRVPIGSHYPVGGVTLGIVRLLLWDRRVKERGR